MSHGYHIFLLNDQRNMFVRVTSKRRSRWDPSHEVAVWRTSQAARNYAACEWPDRRCMILKCEGPEICSCEKYLTDDHWQLEEALRDPEVAERLKAD